MDTANNYERNDSDNTMLRKMLTRAGTQLRLAEERTNLHISEGFVDGHTPILVSGSNPAVAAGVQEVISASGTLDLRTTPILLRVKAGNVNDTLAGSGAQKILVEGVDENYVGVSEILNTAGASPGAAGIQTFCRVHRASVIEAGTYTTTAAGGNVGNVIIEDSAGGSDVIQITAANGQSEQAARTVPAGHTAYLTRVNVTGEGNKATDITLFSREGADIVAAPFTSKQVVLTFRGLLGYAEITFVHYRVFPAKTDIWFAATGAVGGSAVSAECEFLLVADGAGA